MIKSHLLYQLSYAPGAKRPGKAFVKSRSFSKATPHCPAKPGHFSRPKTQPAARPLPSDSRGFSGAYRASLVASEPLGTAIAAPAIAVGVTVHIALHPAVAPTALIVAKSAMMGEN